MRTRFRNTEVRLKLLRLDQSTDRFFVIFFLKPSLINAEFYFTFLLIFQFRYQSSIATLAKERMFEILIIVFALLSNGLYLRYRWRYCSWFFEANETVFIIFKYWRLTMSEADGA